VLGNDGQTAIASLVSGEAKTIEARCPDNTTAEQFFATGGGFVTAANEQVFIIWSHQTTDGLGWQVRARNNSTVAATAVAWVMCLRASKGSE